MTVIYGAKTLVVNDWENMGMGGMDWDKMMHIKLGSDQYGVCNNYTLAGGREMSFLDVEKCNAVCVLGSASAQFFNKARKGGGNLCSIEIKQF